MQYSPTEKNNMLPIIIVSYNTANLLQECLQSLRDACTLPHQTLVVDNHSHDTSVDLVRTHFPEVHMHVLDRNHGFATATNIGLRLLGFGAPYGERQPAPLPDSVLLLNPDTRIHPGSLEAMSTFLQHHPRVGMVGPRLLNPDGSIQAAAFRFPTLSMSVLDVFPPGEALPGRWYNSWWHGRYPEEQTATIPFPIDHPLGACMLVRGRVIEETGLLDEQYFMYSEEIDWCWRIRQAGWAIWQVPQAHITHAGGASTSQFRHRMLIELHRSRIRFFQQHYSSTFLFLHRAITRAGMLRATLQSWLRYIRHQMASQELAARLHAYGKISHL
jgi:hypothetical protein